jgi:hypothetical protein
MESIYTIAVLFSGLNMMTFSACLCLASTVLPNGWILKISNPTFHNEKREPKDEKSSPLL